MNYAIIFALALAYRIALWKVDGISVSEGVLEVEELPEDWYPFASDMDAQ